MKVTYLGNVTPMISYGYDFTNGPVDVPETDKFAIKKYIGNGYFRADHADNFEFGTAEAPKQEITAQEAPVNSIKKVSIGIFKKQGDSKPYSRPEKVFRGEDEDYLRLLADDWMAEKNINPDERLIMVK